MARLAKSSLFIITTLLTSCADAWRGEAAFMWNRGFITIFITTLFFWLTVWMNTAGIPLYMNQAGFGTGAIGFVYATGAIASLLGRMLSGWAIDRIGSRWFLIVGVLLWMLTIPETSITKSETFLILYRLLQGLGLSLFTGASLGYVVYLVPVKLRGSGVSWWGLTNTVATSVAPLAAAFILSRSSFTILFIADSLMAVFAFAGVLFLPKMRVEPSEKTSATEHFRIVSTAALLPGLVGMTLGFAGGAFTVFAPMHIQLMHTISIGVYFSVYALGMLLARLFSGRLSDGRGRSWVIMPGLLLSALGMLTISLDQTQVLSLLGPFLFGFGLGAAVPGLVAWAVDRGKPTERSLSGNTYYLMYEIGMFAGPICVGSAMSVEGFSALSAAFGVICTGVLLYLGWWGTQIVRRRLDNHRGIGT